MKPLQNLRSLRHLLNKKLQSQSKHSVPTGVVSLYPENSTCSAKRGYPEASNCAILPPAEWSSGETQQNNIGNDEEHTKA